MHSSRPHGRGRLIAAIIVSLSFHALIAVGWLNARDHGPAGGANIDPTVDGPDDGEIAFDLRDPPPDPVPNPDPSTVLPDLPTPAPLPSALVHPPVPGVGAVSPVSVSPALPPHLPKFGGAKALHGRPKAGTTIVYILDRSASMGPDGLLRRAANVVQASLAELSPDNRFQIVAYNSGTSVVSAEPLSATPDAKERAIEWLKGLTAEGQSNHRAGFHEALAAKPDQVYLLTDADDLEDSDVRAIAALIRTPVRLSAAVFGEHRPAPGTPLERLVAKWNGSVQYVSP